MARRLLASLYLFIYKRIEGSLVSYKNGQKATENKVQEIISILMSLKELFDWF